MFKPYNRFYDTMSYINYVFEQYNIDLNKCDTEDDYQEMRGLLGEWIQDYVGNMKNDETDKFLNNYGYRNALFEYINLYNVDVMYYCDKQYQLNRLLISHILYSYISSNINKKIYDVYYE